MRCTIMGVGVAEGKSRKTGKEFNCTVLHVAYDAANVNGSACKAIWIDRTYYPERLFNPGDKVDVQMDWNGYVESINFLKEEH